MFPGLDCTLQIQIPTQHLITADLERAVDDLADLYGLDPDLSEVRNTVTTIKVLYCNDFGREAPSIRNSLKTKKDPYRSTCWQGEGVTLGLASRRAMSPGRKAPFSPSVRLEHIAW